ncbi:SOCS box domain-containing protein [Trichonephila clavata]|uniref:SOCS box domain-containing protein n=1 Tax=Trichonephila clavata TaxID=2740835 RepID=A0A8X6LT84_TRICU|nr:SOCS box domain-containing protein [Trichonephila clavata]
MLKRVGCTTHRKLLFDYGMWQFSHFFSGSTIDVAKVHLESAADVVRYSFIVRKSLTYLDLSVGEYGKREKLCFTMDAYKNNVLSKRYVLYSHHLDVSRELDDTTEFNAFHYKTSSKTQGFFLKKVLVVDKNVYNMNIKPYVVTAIRKSNNKIRALMKYYKLLIIQKENFAKNYFLYMKLISNERRDSELVCQLLKEQQFYAIHIFFQHYDEHLVDFALYHATRAKCRLFEEIPFSWRPHLFYGRYECFYQLIKYGYNYPFFSGDFLPCLRDVTDHCM